ncbi:MAG TPA: hypothetical protein VLC11_07665 [Gemmatimonadales bacterium]|nr:hypothetical protein [Gemmatimonadales bacterium]
MILTVAQVAGAARSPLDAVATHWPRLAAALADVGDDTGPAEVALAATVAVETAYTFRPVSEKWPRGQTAEEYFSRYAPPHPVATALGNRSVADAVAYRGRGFIQITGRANYARYGVLLGVDLVDTPEQALDPDVSARVAAQYLHGHAIPGLAAQGQWQAVRRAVNGGLNGYAEFQAIVDMLLTHLPETA